MESKEVNQLNPLSLAFLGDSVFTLFIREYLVSHSDSKSGALHKVASGYVCARSQAIMLDALSEIFTEKEKEIARRCRNAHNTSKAKNAGLSDYKKATALEGVFGYLRLVGEDERLKELMEKCVQVIDEGEKNE